MKKVKFGSLLVNRGNSEYEPFLIKVLSSLVAFPDGESLLAKFVKMKNKVDSISATGIYVQVVPRLPEEPMQNIVYLVDDSKGDFLPKTVLIRIVEKLPETIDTHVLYLVDSSGITPDGTSDGPTTDIGFNIDLNHTHSNQDIIDTYTMTQEELLNSVKTDINESTEDVEEDITELQIMFDVLDDQVDSIDEKVGDGFEPIPNEDIDGLNKSIKNSTN